MRRTQAFLASLATLFASAGLALAAGVDVGAGSSLDLGTGSIDLGCGNLDVSGGFDVASGGVSQAQHVAIVSGGTLDGGSGTLEVGGDWSNAGTFTAGTGTVAFVDACGGPTASVTGNNTFANLSMTTATGKEYRFGAGSTQTIASNLSLTGASGNLLLIRSTTNGVQANFDAQGTNTLHYVDVQDNDASPAPIFVPDNSVKGSNTSGWLTIAMVPGLSLLGLALLTGLLGRLGYRGSRPTQ